MENHILWWENLTPTEKQDKTNKYYCMFRQIFWKDVHSIKNGPVAEWLGRGLQNLVRRFESVRDLIKTLDFQ